MNQIRGFIHSGINDPQQQQEIPSSKSPRKSHNSRKFSTQPQSFSNTPEHGDNNPYTNQIKKSASLTVIPIKCPTSQPEEHSIQISGRHVFSRSVSYTDTKPYSPNFIIPNQIFSPGHLEPIEETSVLEYSEVKTDGFQIPLGKIKSNEIAKHLIGVDTPVSVWEAKNYDLDLDEAPVSLKERFKGKDWGD
jgi:hypothetical protein